MRVHRIDVGTLAAPVRRADGSMIVQAKLARTGVQVYSNADGTPRHEYRPATNVFDQSSIDSFKLVPFTNDHPPEMVSSQNARQYQVGTVGQDVHQDGNWMVATIAIHDAQAIKDLEAGKNQLSNGYDCDLVMTPGVSPDGEHFDAIQTNITGNHVALVWNARAGQEAAVRMDAACALDERNTTMANAKLQKACEARGARYDAADDHGSALALLAKCGHPATEKTSNGQTLAQRGDDYLVQRAIATADIVLHADDRYATEQPHVDHFDGHHTDGLHQDEQGYLTWNHHNDETNSEYQKMLDRNREQWIENASPIVGDDKTAYQNDIRDQLKLDAKLEARKAVDIKRANAERSDASSGSVTDAYNAMVERNRKGER